MPYHAGVAVLEIAPSFLNVEKMIARAARDLAKGLDKQLGDNLGKAMQNAAKDAEPEAARAGQSMGRAFANNAMKNVESALSRIPKSDRVLKPLREELLAISRIDITKGFDEKAFIARVERAHEALLKAQQDANGVNAVGRFTNAGAAAADLAATRAVVEAARRRGFQAGDAYETAYQARLKAMRTATPDLKIRQGSSPDERAAAAIRQRIDDAARVRVGDVVTRENNPLGLKIGVKVSREDLAREMAFIEGQLDQFVENFATSDLLLPFDKARIQAGAFFEDTKTQAEKSAEAQAKAYLDAWDEAHREQGRRDQKFRADLRRANDDAIAEDYKREKKKADDVLRLWDEVAKEQYKRDLRGRQELAKAHEDAIAEDFKRQRRAVDDFDRLWEQAQLEQYKRDLRARNDFDRMYDDAVAEGYKRQRRQQDNFLAQWDDAVKEQHKRDLKARQDFDRMYDAAIAEGYKRRRKADDDYRRDYEAALLENTRRTADMLRGTTAGRANKQTAAAASALPDVPVHLRTTEAEKEIAEIRERLLALGDLQIGINIESGTFADRVEAEFDRLRAIVRNKKLSIEVRTDAAKAASELGSILVELDRIKKNKAEVTVDTAGANQGLREMLASLSLNLGRLGALIATGASLGTAIVPAAAAAASAIGAIGTAALAGGAGLGVMILAFSGIGEAVGLMNKAAEEQDKTAKAVTRSGNQIAAAQDQVKSAEMALANTRRNNAQAAMKAQRAIRDAIQDQRDASRAAARDMQDAIEAVSDAQRDLADAESDARRTREGLNEAYRQAQRAIQDLNSALRGNALNQRQATLDIAEAKIELDKALANPRATEAEREQARITYEQRLLQMDDLKRKGRELSDEQDKRFASGIRGSDEVKRAQEAIADAEERVTDAQRRLARAQQDRNDAAVNGQRRIREAQQKVADAQQAAADQQKDAAYSLFTANQGLVSAQRSLANAYAGTATAGGAALNNLEAKLAGMTPAARAFAEYIFGLKEAFLGLKAAADPVIGGLHTALVGLIGATSDEAYVKLEPLFGFVSRVSQAIGGMFVRLANVLSGRTFTLFFNYIDLTAVPTLERMYQAFENVLVGVTNLFLAFTPLSLDVERGFVGLTEKFLEWSQTLDTNQGFQRFLAYLKESGPQVAHLIGEMVQSLVKLAQAAAPIGSLVVDMFIQLFEWINKIPEKTLIALVGGISAAAAALAVFAGVTAAMALSTAGAVAAGIALLVVAFAALVGSSSTLREKLAAVWEAVKTGAGVAFEFLKALAVELKPVFDHTVEAVLSLYHDGLKPAFDSAYELVKGVIDGLRPYFDDIKGTFAQLGQIALYLYDQAILPAFRGIMVVVHELLDVFTPVFKSINEIVTVLAGIFFWLLNKVILPVVGFIVKLLVKILTPAFKFVWAFVKPILQNLGLVIQVLAAIVKVAIGIILIALKAMAAYWKFLFQVIVKPVWDWAVKNVFRPMGEWISKNIAPHWNKAIKKLGEAWANLKKGIGTPIKFIVETLMNDGLLKAYNWLAERFDIEPRNVKIPAPKGGWTGFARGGAVYGPGTATSDSIPARLSRGEHVLTAAEVRAAGGHGAIYALRQALLKGIQLPGFARGGAVGNGRGEVGDNFGGWLKKMGKGIKDKATDVFDGAAQFLRDPMGSLKVLAKVLFDKVPGKDTWFVQKLMTLPVKILDSLQDKVKDIFAGFGQEGVGNGVSGYGNGLGGSGGMIAILRRVFPGLNLNSGLRPGAITATGKPSLHGKNRAVDVPPRMDVFEWIRANYPNSHELIFSPAGRRQLYRGKNHMYTGVTRNMHFNHVHWGYDNGGLLPDTRNMPGGVMQVFHGRRTPDKVLTDNQWSNMAVLASKARQSMAGGDTWHFDFKDTTLDEGRLQALQARRDALNRVNRSNF